MLPEAVLATALEVRALEPALERAESLAQVVAQEMAASQEMPLAPVAPS